MPVVPFNKKPPPPPQAPAKSIAERVNAVPDGFDVNFEEVTRYIADEAANGSNADEVVYSANVEVALRALCRQLGFERIPLTYGELNALLEYGHMLRNTRGETVKDPMQRELWQLVSGKAFLSQYPDHADALALFQAGDLAGLSRYHATARTLDELGRRYRQFDD